MSVVYNFNSFFFTLFLHFFNTILFFSSLILLNTNICVLKEQHLMRPLKICKNRCGEGWARKEVRKLVINDEAIVRWVPLKAEKINPFTYSSCWLT